MSKRIIVTGGSGFIGTNLIKLLSDNRWDIVNLDIKQPRNPEHSYLWHKADILDIKKIKQEFDNFQPSFVVHLAARTDLTGQTDISEYAANYVGTSNVIDAIRNVPSIERVIFTSSQLVCPIGYQPKDLMDLQPTTLYGQSKVLMEKTIQVMPDFHPIWVIVRPTSIWGPWFDIPYRYFFDTIKKGLYVHPQKIEVKKQWGYVGNVVYQIACLLDAKGDQINNKVFYLADYDPFDLGEFADIVSRQFHKGDVHRISLVLLKIFARIGSLLQRLGWKTPPLTNFRLTNIISDEIFDLTPLRIVAGDLPYNIQQGIVETINWMNKN